MGDNIVVVALECTGCNGKNRYHIRKNKKVQRDKLEIKKYCKLCNKLLNSPLSYHLLITCNALDQYRHVYWNHSRHTLSQIGSKLNTIHQ